MKTQASFSIEEEALKTLDQYADAERRTRSGLIAKIVADWLESRTR